MQLKGLSALIVGDTQKKKLLVSQKQFLIYIIVVACLLSLDPILPPPFSLFCFLEKFFEESYTITKSQHLIELGQGDAVQEMKLFVAPR